MVKKGNAGGPKSNASKEKHARQKMVLMLSQQGLTSSQISESLAAGNFSSHSLSIVKQDLREIDELHKEEFPDDIAKVKRKNLSGLQRLLYLALDGFRRSQQDELVVTHKYYRDEDGNEQVERTERRRGQAGDPRFIGEARQVYHEVASLYGLTELKISGELNVTDKDYDSQAAQLFEQIIEDVMRAPPTVTGEVIESHVDDWEQKVRGRNGNGKAKLGHDDE